MNWYAVRTKSKKKCWQKIIILRLALRPMFQLTQRKELVRQNKKTKVSAIPGYLFFKLKEIDFNLINLNPTPQITIELAQEHQL